MDQKAVDELRARTQAARSAVAHAAAEAELKIAVLKEILKEQNLLNARLAALL